MPLAPSNFYFHIAFPPHEITSTMEVEPPIEIPNMWAGPETYAEDFYAGGDVHPRLSGEVSPHYLGIGDEEVHDSTPVPNSPVVEALYNDVIDMVSPQSLKEASRELDQPLDSIEEVVQPEVEKRPVEDAEEATSGSLRQPFEEFLQSQDGQSTEELNFDALYGDIDMRSFDTSTLNAGQTGMLLTDVPGYCTNMLTPFMLAVAWDFSAGIPGEEAIPTPSDFFAFHESTATTFVQADFKLIDLTGDDRMQDEVLAIQDAELHASAEVGKSSDVQGPVDGQEQADGQGLVDVQDADEVRELGEIQDPVEMQESPVVQPVVEDIGDGKEPVIEDHEPIAMLNPVEPQSPVEVVEPVMQDSVQTLVRDSDIDEVDKDSHTQNGGMSRASCLLHVI
jgi:hypothetical protein